MPNFSLAWRFLFSFLLVLATFNPTGYSYFHWAAQVLPKVNGLLALFSLVLLAAWIFFVRSTFRSLGLIGVGIAVAFCAALVWVGVDMGVVELSNKGLVTWIALFVIALVLGIGMSWSTIRQKMTGQHDGGPAPV
jgi:hypothetical protein